MAVRKNNMYIFFTGLGSVRGETNGKRTTYFGLLPMCTLEITLGIFDLICQHLAGSAAAGGY